MADRGVQPLTDGAARGTVRAGQCAARGAGDGDVRRHKSEKRLADLVDVSVDPYVIDLDEERLPKRVRLPSTRRKGPDG